MAHQIKFRVYTQQVKCQRLFRPKISKVKTSFFAEIRQVP